MERRARVDEIRSVQARTCPQEQSLTYHR